MLGVGNVNQKSQRACNNVHISCGVSSVLFSAIVKTWKLLFQFFCTSSYMLFSLLFTFDLHSHFVRIHKTVEAFDVGAVRIVILLRFRH
jgi:hypothetical protein